MPRNSKTLPLHDDRNLLIKQGLIVFYEYQKQVRTFPTGYSVGFTNVPANLSFLFRYIMACENIDVEVLYDYINMYETHYTCQNSSKSKVTTFVNAICSSRLM